MKMLKIMIFKNLTSKIIFNVYSCPKEMKFCEIHLRSLYYLILKVLLKKLPLRIVKDLLWPKISEKFGFGGQNGIFMTQWVIFRKKYLLGRVIYAS